MYCMKTYHSIVYYCTALAEIALHCVDLKLWQRSHPWQFPENGGGQFMEEMFEELSRIAINCDDQETFRDAVITKEKKTWKFSKLGGRGLVG